MAMMAAAVAAMTLGELLGPAAGAHAAVAVTDLVSDSREVSPGAAFIALAGYRSHGLEYAADALAAGAKIVVYEPPVTAGLHLPQPSLALPDLRARLGELGRRFYGRSGLPDALIGVTGTNGKTTVAWLVASALSALDEPCGYIGTLGYGVPGAMRPQALTTPDCLGLHRELAEIGRPRAVLEVSSHAIAQDRIAGLGFEGAVFTNLSHDHLDWHGSMDAYFEAKAKLFARDELVFAVVNVSDAYGRQLLKRISPAARTVAVKLDGGSSADLVARAESRGLDGQVLHVSGGYGEARIASSLIGDFNAENLLLALGAVLACGHEIEAAGGALSGAAAPPGRMEVFGGPPGRPWVIVDYAHTPDALMRVLSAIATMKSGGLTAVFGCGGDRDRDKRAPMGRAAALYADHIVLTDDNPRGEDPAEIVAAIAAGAAGHSDIRIVHSRELAIEGAVRAAAPGDIVLVAGKGHETRQLAGGESRAFDDRAMVRGVLEGMT
jgi:UDP-N-acetylmuramoyl-L-alanyl-D-glutamate--2,6-diaminopimelate ligase